MAIGRIGPEAAQSLRRIAGYTAPKEIRMPIPMNRRQFLGAAAAATAVAKTPPYEGIFVIMQTPFQSTLEIDEECLRREADFLVRGGVHGLVWPAGAGETSSIWHGERLK